MFCEIESNFKSVHFFFIHPVYIVLQSINGQLKSCHLTLAAKSVTLLIKTYIADTISIPFFVVDLSLLLSVSGGMLLRLRDYPVTNIQCTFKICV